MGVAVWKLTPYGKTRRPLAGVPWRDLSVEEMAEAQQLHPGIEDNGCFELAEITEDEKPTRRRSRED